MTLKEVTARILEAQKHVGQDLPTFLALNRAIFLDLARQNEAYIIPDKPVPSDLLARKMFLPYIGTAQENDSRKFIRVFSHEEAAKQFSEKALINQYVKLDGIELMQLARFYFLHGVFGFLLNDGMVWTSLSFPDFLRECILNILGDPSLIREEYIALIQLINMVRQNEYYRVSIAYQTVKDIKRPEVIYFLDQESARRLECPGFIIEQLTVQRLVQSGSMPDTACVWIRTASINVKIAPNMLRAALCATEIAKSPDEYTTLDFHVDTIALDFCIKDFDGLETAESRQTQLVSVPASNGGGPDPAPSAWHMVGSRIILSFSKIISFLRTTHISEPTSSGSPPGKTKGSRSFISILSSNFQRLPFEKKMAVGFCAAALSLVILSVFVNGARPTPLETFQATISKGDYSQLAEKYDACISADAGAKTDLLPLMAMDLQSRLNSYASDECSAQSLLTALEAYQAIPDMRDLTDSIYKTASTLEQSKKCFSKGLLETSIIARLRDWREVIELDTGSIHAIDRDLVKNRNTYIQSVLLENRGALPKDALSNLYLLQSYYPDDREIDMAISNLLDNSSQADVTVSTGDRGEEEPPSGPSYPIRILSALTSSADADGTIDLRIEWAYNSDSIIDKVVFTAIPISSDGTELTTTVDTGNRLYSKYLAVADGPFPPGQSSGKEFIWPSAWVNASITGVKIHSVQIYIRGQDSILIPEEAIPNLF